MIARPRSLRPALARFGLAALVVSATVLSAGVATAAAAPAPSADADVTWGVRTATNAQGSARDNFAYVVGPGGTVDDAIVVTNHDDQPLDLDLYAADGFTTQSGQLDVLTRGEESSEVGVWTGVGQERVQIPAGASAEIPFTISVPENATPGDYAGGIITSLAQPAQEDGITVDRRLGIRVQLRVDGALQPGLVVEGLTVGFAGSLNPFAGGTATVDYTVRNTGNVRLSGQQSVALYGPFGLFRSDIEGVDDVPEILPGESWTVSATAQGIFPLAWLGTDVTIDPAFPAGLESGPDLAMFVTSSGTVAIPWSLVALVLLLGAAVVVIVVLRRRARRRRKQSEDARVQAAVAAALKEQRPPAHASSHDEVAVGAGAGERST
ncbi:DUF916 domain-containing protein [Microbacterium sp. Gd 4-13]|uniref:WxL protein peptidoglycan domain-containing protein n=1 Tax=Microbacterium sp. Gd 4-13 TaxID=2173179 RepID=UPI000D584927|nr:DUF916 domain-containing protein [Microbacterium sp. Gd 4-13]PVW02543.1 DUF916 domain-containing protein [Microbacterium sp. Gd 4-13]